MKKFFLTGILYFCAVFFCAAESEKIFLTEEAFLDREFCICSISDEVFEKLKSFFSDSEIVAIVGFATQMIATNNFNSVLKIDVDERLLPIQGEFKPATWRENIK